LECCVDGRIGWCNDVGTGFGQDVKTEPFLDHIRIFWCPPEGSGFHLRGDWWFLLNSDWKAIDILT